MVGWRNDALGVTPVVAQVLMIAIVVAVGAAMIPLYNELVQDQPQRAPEVSLLYDTDKHELTFVSGVWVAGDLLWEDLQVAGCDASGLTGRPQGGEVLSCNADIRIRHVPTDAVIWMYSR